MSRHPYTYSADYIRGLAGYNKQGTILSRSEASQIREGIAVALGISDVELAEKLSDYYQANEESLSTEAAASLIAALRS